MAVVAGMSTHRETMSGALIKLELAHFTELPHPGLHPTHIRYRGPPIVRAVQDQRGYDHALGEVVRLRAGLGVRRPEGEAMEDDDHAELLMRSGGHERVHPAAAEAEHGHSRLDRKSTRLNSSHVATSYAVFCLKKKNNHSR